MCYNVRCREKKGGIVMTELLYTIIGWITSIHRWVLSLNDSRELYFTDKELHFIVIGVLGMLMVFLIHPIFTLLAKNNHVMVITWLYVFTIILVITFAIEIGQGYSHTGNVEMADVIAGLAGFICFFAVFSLVRMLYHLICRIIAHMKNPDQEIL